MKKLIAIALTLVLCLSVMSVAAFAAPEGLNSLALVGTGIPGVPEWKPEAPEGDMTEVSEGIFEKTLTCPAGTSMKLKIAGNDAWVDAWNFGSATLVLGQKADLENSGGSGDMPLTVDKDCTLKVTVDVNPLANGGAATILVEEVTAGGNTQPTQPQATQPQATEPQATQPAASTGKVMLYVKVPADWTKVYAYSWDASENALLGAWPGSAITGKDGEWVKGEIPNNLTNLVISTDGKQTQNLQLDAGKNVWVAVSDKAVDGKHEATVTYTAPAGSNSGNTTPTKPQGGQAADPTPQGTLSNYRVVGSAAWMGNWDPANDAGRMIDVGNGVYKKNFENVEPGSYELKVTKDGKWDVSYGDGTGQNFTFTVTEKCTITVTFTLKDNQGVIHVKGAGVPSTADVSMVSVIVLLVLATTATAVLVINKKKFI